MKKKNVPDFLKAKGFYISLLTGICALCVICIVYVSMLTSNNKDNVVDLNETNTQTEDMVKDIQNTEVADTNLINEQNVAGIDVDIPSDLTGDAEVQDAEEVKETASNEVVTEPQEDETQAVATSGKATNLAFDEEEGLLWPVDGNVIMNYSMSSVIYFQTLDQFKCNPAIIIQAKVGEDVLNAAKGIVSEISYNEETGNTVTISIGDGYEVIYGQLDEKLNVEEGQTIEEGTIIGTVAKPTKYYVKEGTNLFFEVLRDEETVNPMLLLR
ncbi:M23 family metallopeptidase [Anaerosporobacter sp.]|uniref:M23 family metallopeptidase n=1 Tax=Anaerosporobacter sp. TaxID=1872529 RepID=UPI00286EF859|nr:M23 family metallopeptidase [Anaerosporobacter sp.]